MTSSNPSILNLTATYQSPTNEPFTHTQPLPAPPTSSPADRVAYLGALKKAVVEIQERINKELTEKMEEDKAKDGAGKGKAAEVDEKKEEDNYGEEVVEED